MCRAPYCFLIARWSSKCPLSCPCAGPSSVLWLPSSGADSLRAAWRERERIPSGEVHSVRATAAPKPPPPRLSSQQHVPPAEVPIRRREREKKIKDRLWEREEKKGEVERKGRKERRGWERKKDEIRSTFFFTLLPMANDTWQIRNYQQDRHVKLP